VPDRLVPLILDLNLVQPMGDLTLYEQGLVLLD
jgi:hypothetical protein